LGFFFNAKAQREEMDMNRTMIAVSALALVYYSSVGYAQNVSDTDLDAPVTVVSVNAPPLVVPPLIIPALIIPALNYGDEPRHGGRVPQLASNGFGDGVFAGNGFGQGRFEPTRFNSARVPLNLNPGVSTRPSSPYFDYSRSPGVVRISGVVMRKK
jgi:hypothetical protein